METEEFEAWLAGISRLDLAQRGRALSAQSDVESACVQAVVVAPAGVNGQRYAEPSEATQVRAGDFALGPLDPSEVETVAAIVRRKVEAFVRHDVNARDGTCQRQ